MYPALSREWGGGGDGEGVLECEMVIDHQLGRFRAWCLRLMCPEISAKPHLSPDPMCHYA